MAYAKTRRRSLRLAEIRQDTLEDDSMSHPPIGRASSRYLTNEEAAEFLRLSPRTLEKHRTIGGGPRFRRFCGRIFYAIQDLEAWAESRSFEMTSQPEYLALRGCRSRRG